ncbi:MAG: GspE/PulE family protein [bacterium]
MSASDSKKKELESKLSEIKQNEEENRTKELAEKFKLPYINLLIVPINPNDLAIIPEEKAKKGELVVIKKTGKILRLAINNPKNLQTKQIIEELKKQGFECRLFISSLASIKKSWLRYEQLKHKLKETPLRGVLIIENNDLQKFKKYFKTINEFKKAIRNLSTTELLAMTMSGAVEMNASDIHIEPEKEKIRMRYRIDGLLQEIADFPTGDYRFFLSRIKTLSDMLLNVHDASQDGRFTIKIKEPKQDKIIDVRVSILPSSYGESIVMRLLSESSVQLKFDQLGIRPEFIKIIETQTKRPNGMILTTGPTGSGKTTSLYTCLNYVNKPGKKIITVEDPVEYRLQGITQTQISKRKGNTFANALKSVVRQDPDILMVGEIRDNESAEISVQFALTGHLVFSTIHTNNAAGAIPRLTDMKIKPDALASSLNLIIAQRLLRKLCPDCKEAYKPDTKTIQDIEKGLSLISTKIGIKIPKTIQTLYKPKGCEKCHGLGYKDRVGIFEMLTVSEEINKLIINKVAAFEIQKKAQEQGMIILTQDALLRTVEGITSLEETERVIGSIMSTNL